MKPVEIKEFVVVLTCRTVKSVSNHTVYEIPDAFSAMSLGVEVSKLHVRTCVYRL